MEGALFSLVAYFLTSRWFRTLRFFADRDLRFVLVFSGGPRHTTSLTGKRRMEGRV